MRNKDRKAGGGRGEQRQKWREIEKVADRGAQREVQGWDLQCSWARITSGVRGMWMGPRPFATPSQRPSDRGTFLYPQAWKGQASRQNS